MCDFNLQDSKSLASIWTHIAFYTLQWLFSLIVGQVAN